MTTQTERQLDTDARGMLGVIGYSEYHAYKQRLREDGHTWEEIEPILRGYVWSQLGD